MKRCALWLGLWVSCYIGAALAHFKPVPFGVLMLLGTGCLIAFAAALVGVVFR